MSKVLVVGTGTIGMPLIGLLSDFKDEFSIEQVIFHKRTPLAHDATHVKSLQKRGAYLCIDNDNIAGFLELGMVPEYDLHSAQRQADVIIDCTPAGNINKKRWYNHITDNTKGFIAQGSEKGFGKIYAQGINEKAFSKDDKFIQVASCNTHNIAVLIKLFRTLGEIEKSRFVCLRRANDISQNSGMSPGVEISEHDDPTYGTHHGEDVARLYKTIGIDLDIHTSACKLPTQYMHTIHFDVTMKQASWRKNLSVETVLMAIRGNDSIATTNKTTSNKVFSFGRDQGYYGRLLTQTIIPISSITTREKWQSGQEIMGFCFTPQDGNSLLSSISSTLWLLHNKSWEESKERMKCLDRFMFQEV